MLSVLANTIRIKTLTASLIPILVSHFLYRGSFWITTFAALSACLIQIGTNLFNDAQDAITGVDTSERLGPKRATHLGLASPKTIKLLSHVCFSLAVLFGVPLVVEGGWLVVGVGLSSVFLGYAYTGAFNINLSSSGLADLVVIIFFGIIPIAVLSYLHLGYVAKGAWFIGLGFGFLANTLLTVNNIRDLKTDQIAGRRTVPIRIGERGSRLLCAFEVLAGVLLLSSQVTVVLLALFPGFYLIYRILYLNDWNKTLGLSGLLHSLSGILIIFSELYLD
jgi:1,4-dihydroxy-2-naphthoate octaprenyltransferase